VWLISQSQGQRNADVVQWQALRAVYAFKPQKETDVLLALSITFWKVGGRFCRCT
jgi:hypothetical protein